ncbi:MAG TPA: DNA replication/repair protein RecF [Bacteroidales bacterium]|nr:DNA replication/repair protein RecF [Bacteroidales bacterium]HSA42546.1 DNA replication/repair protein RecF [Bacteroidales bacterium]
MYLKHLTLSNFKNYPEADLELSPKINCFVGDNGVGKTNLLDAMYYLSFCKSCFNPQDMQNIRDEEEYFAIHGYYRKNGDQEDVVSCIQKRGLRKQFRLNRKDYDRLADHIGLFPLVMVSPGDTDLIGSGSEERRKYLDGVISQFDRVYLDNLLVYNRVLQQRNSLLKQAEDSAMAATALEAWDLQLVDPAHLIHRKRDEFLREFIPIFQTFFNIISGGRETVGIAYESQLHTAGLAALLKESLRRDLLLRFTTTGIHKDELSFTIRGLPVRKFGSQGQQKSFLVALRLAQFEYTRRLKGFKPLLLFDDIFDKLDEKRVSQIIRLVGEDNFGQVMITDTHPERIKQIFREIQLDHKIFHITASNTISCL